jgi:hypothetical protein
VTLVRSIVLADAARDVLEAAVRPGTTRSYNFITAVDKSAAPLSASTALPAR